MSEVKPRGVKRGETPAWNVGRKATGRERNKNISFRVSESEKEFIYKVLDTLEKDRTTAIIDIFNFYLDNKTY